MIIGLIWTGFAVYQTTKISPLTKEESYLDSSHPARRGGIIMDKFVLNSDDKTDVKFFWGVSDIDDSEVSQWEPSFFGTAVLDPDFNGTSTDSVEFLN